MSTKLDLLDPTHRGLHRFVPRHNDEIEIDIGDPVYVQKEAEDLWCEGKKVTFKGSFINEVTQFLNIPVIILCKKGLSGFAT